MLFRSVLRKTSMAEMGRDPNKEVIAEEDRAAQKLAIDPEQIKAMQEANAMRKKWFEEQYDPERQREQGLIAALIGAGGRRYGEFGAAAAAGRSYDQAQREAKLKEFDAMQKGIMEPYNLKRGVIEKSMEYGKGVRTAAEEARSEEHTSELQSH